MKTVRFAKNQSHLAELLGVHRQRISSLQKKEGAPKSREDGRIEVEPWRKFLLETAEEVDTPEIAELKRQIAAEDLRKKKTKNDEEARLLVRMEELTREAGPTLATIKDLLYQKIGQEMPTAVAGVDVPTGRMIGNRIAGELLTKFQELFRKWVV